MDGITKEQMQVYGALAHNLYVAFIAAHSGVRMATAERTYPPDPDMDPAWILFAEAISLDRQAAFTLQLRETMDPGQRARYDQLRIDFHLGLQDLVAKLLKGMQQPPPAPGLVQ